MVALAAAHGAVPLIHYLALLLTPFFEEVALTVNAASPQSPYWFRVLPVRRGLCAVRRDASGRRSRRPGCRCLMRRCILVDFGYYPFITLGIVIAWRGWESAEPRVRGSIRRWPA